MTKQSTLSYITKSGILQTNQAKAAVWLKTNFSETVGAICDDVERLTVSRGKLPEKVRVTAYRVIVKSCHKGLTDMQVGAIRSVLNEVWRINKSKIEVFQHES